MSTIHFHVSPPILNLNGTSAEMLLEQRHKLAQALELARSDLREAAPNGRDWQTVRDPATFKAAQAEHARRDDALRLLIDVVRAEIEAIDAQQLERDSLKPRDRAGR